MGERSKTDQALEIVAGVSEASLRIAAVAVEIVAGRALGRGEVEVDDLPPARPHGRARFYTGEGVVTALHPDGVERRGFERRNRFQRRQNDRALGELGLDSDRFHRSVRTRRELDDSLTVPHSTPKPRS